MTIVSVVMPVHNTARYVAGAVESILTQTLDGLELIAVDDGSTDGSGQILERYSAADRRVRVVRREQKGIVSSRNEGIDLALGEFLAVLDSDDVALPGRLTLQVAYLRDHPDCVAVGGWTEVVDDTGEAICTWRYPCDHEELDLRNLANNQAMLHSSLVMRRDAVRDVGGYRPEAETAEELDLLLRLGEVGRLANVPEVVVKYRRHGASVSHARRARQLIASEFAIRDARRRRGMGDVDAPVPNCRDTASVGENRRTWAWWALGDRNIAAARKHAWGALRAEPFARESWRVLACALRGRANPAD